MFEKPKNIEGYVNYTFLILFFLFSFLFIRDVVSFGGVLFDGLLGGGSALLALLLYKLLFKKKIFLKLLILGGYLILILSVKYSIEKKSFKGEWIALEGDVQLDLTIASDSLFIVSSTGVNQAYMYVKEGSALYLSNDELSDEMVWELKMMSDEIIIINIKEDDIELRFRKKGSF